MFSLLVTTFKFVENDKITIKMLRVAVEYSIMKIKLRNFQTL